jgi:hypothetical protein
LPDGLSEILDAEESTLDLRGVCRIPFTDPGLELVKPCALVLDQSTAFRSLVCPERADVDAMCIPGTVDPQDASDRRE